MEKKKFEDYSEEIKFKAQKGIKKKNIRQM